MYYGPSSCTPTAAAAAAAILDFCNSVLRADQPLCSSMVPCIRFFGSGCGHCTCRVRKQNLGQLATHISVQVLNRSARMAAHVLRH